jgi:hypothetical protein
VSPLQPAGTIVDSSGNGSDLLTGLEFYMHTDAAGATGNLIAGSDGGTTNHFKWEFITLAGSTSSSWTVYCPLTTTAVHASKFFIS